MKKANILIFAGFMSLSLIMTSCDKKGNKTPEKELAEYTIKFVDYDQELLSEIKVKEGVVPAYDKEEPYRDPTREHSYTFSGWTPTIVAATADATYTATYEEEVRKYTIRFVDDDDTELQKESLPYGAMPEYKGAAPTKAATAQYTYSFLNWDKPIATVTGNATYKATYNSVVNQYEVIFDTHGGSEVSSQTVPYGGHVTKPDDPNREATGDAYYVFEGWDFDFDNTTVTGPITINAQWYEVDSSMPHGNDCVYIHYPQYLPRTGEFGYKEFWYCPVHHQYVMAEPASTHIVEAPSHYSGEILSSDERFISLIYDENHLPLTEYSYGADQYLVEEDDYKTWKVTYQENGFDCLLYSDSARKLLWRIELPRIDYTRYPTVTMKVDAPNWYEGNMMGPEEDDLPYHTVYGGNKNKGQIQLALTGAGVFMNFVNIEYGDSIAFSNIFTDSDIMHGLKSAYFYTQDLYDRYLNISDITISTESNPVDISSYGGETTKLSVVNGSVSLPSKVDFGIINKGYGTDQNSLLVEGNSSSDATTISLPAFNFNTYTSLGNVFFKFGIRNNKEMMYFGSGDLKVSLGSNSPTSQSENDSGYINWEMIVTDSLAYIHNTYENTNTVVQLTSGMRNGSERIVLSGGNPSIYRRYLLCDFYWKLNADYPLVSPGSCTDIYAYGGNTASVLVENATVTLPHDVDYSIISNNYGTNQTSLLIEGNANPGAAVIVLPAIDFNQFTSLGTITFKFGVRNNSEHMYFGSGDTKVDLGSNAPNSESSNNNGYVNWEMFITASEAHVHNTYEDHDYTISLTTGMRNGTESIVISGGNTSIYRRYLVCDFYLVS